MATSFAAGAKEIWESTIEGRISLEVLNAKGRPQTLSILGKAQRLRITAEERELVEEGIRDPQNNPFTNGMLVQVNRKEGLAAIDELSDDDLAQLFDLKGDDFMEAVRSLSEVNVRRLKAMTTERDASKSQVEFLDTHVAVTWPIGSDTPANAEARGDRLPAR